MFSPQVLQNKITELKRNDRGTNHHGQTPLSCPHHKGLQPISKFDGLNILTSCNLC